MNIGKEIFDITLLAKKMRDEKKEKERKLQVYAIQLEKDLTLNLIILLNNLELALRKRTKFREFENVKWIDELSHFKNEFTGEYHNSYKLISNFFTEIYYLNSKIKNGDFVKNDIIKLGEMIFINIFFPYVFYLNDSLITSIVNDDIFNFFKKIKSFNSSEVEKELFNKKRINQKFPNSNYYRKTIDKYIEMVFNENNEMIYCKLLLPSSEYSDSLEKFIDGTYENGKIKEGFIKIPNNPPIDENDLPDFTYIGEVKNFVAHGRGSIKIKGEYETFIFENGKKKK